MHGRRGRSSSALALAAIMSTAAIAVAQEPAAVVGTEGPDALAGTDAGEALYGRGGDDTLDGAAGDDTLDGGSGADVLRGGAGQDAVVYGGATPVTVSLNGAADDGAPGEGDDVAADVEDVYGGAGADAISGDDAPNQLDGAGGDDRLTGGAGRDGLVGGPGSDIVDARDGQADHVDCGEGADTALVDAIDVVAGCEKKEVARLPGVVRVFASGSTTRVLELRATNMPPGSRIELSCKGSGCRFRGPLTIAAKAETVALEKNFRGARLRRGATILVRLLAPSTPTRVFRFTVRGPRRPVAVVSPE